MKYLKKHWLYISIIALTLAVFIAAYRPTLFNFFIADDFLYFTWANDVLNRPELLLDVYRGSWNGFNARIASVDASLFYRPLFHTMIFFEYVLWGACILNSRIVNMVIELLAGIMLSLTVCALSKSSIKSTATNKQACSIWGLYSGILFILFPLHSEPVNWVSARMDPLVTIFMLFSLWSYVRWRKSSLRTYIILSLTSCILAFLTKEMAVALPPTILAYEMIFHRSITDNPTNNFIAKIKQWYELIAPTLPYWYVLILYFCLRKWLLGDFIAGYRGDFLEFFSLSGWIKGLYAIVVPINPLLTGSHDLVFKLWHLLLFVAIAFTVIATVKTDRSKLRPVYFLLIWFLICLAPTYKVFPTMMSAGFGSRLGYLATAPFCTFLTYGIANFSVASRISALFRLVAMAFFAVSAIILYTNNIAWAEAGILTNKIVQQFKEYYRGTPGDPPVYVVGLPDFCKKGGIATLIGTLNGMTKKPIMERNLYNCTRLNSDDRFTSFGFLKDNIISNQKAMHLLYWDSQSETLKPVVFFPPVRKVTLWKGKDLINVISAPYFPTISQPQSHWMNDGSLELVAHKNQKIFNIIELHLPDLSCCSTDFLTVKIRFTNLTNLGPFKKAELFFTNQIAKKYSMEYFSLDRCHAPIKLTNEEQEIVFPLGSLPAWSMGGKCSSMRIVLPVGCDDIQIKAVSLPSSSNLKPQIRLPLSATETPGEMRLDRSNNLQYIQYDARSLKGCLQMVLEIAQPFRFIESLDSDEGHKKIFIEKRSSNSFGKFKISRTEFPKEKTICRARIKALDEAGEQIGFPSDYFFICTD